SYAFTIAGIAVGVAGLVALGAMSERIVRFIEGGDRFVLGQISVAGRGMGMGAGFTAGGLLPAAALARIAGVEGVSGVQAQVMLPLNPSTSQFMTLTQELVLGRMLTAPDRFVIVPIEDARAQWLAKDRLLQTLLASGAAALTAADLNTGAAVGWRDGEDPDAVARRILAQVPGVHVQLPSELSSLLRSS